MADSQGHVWGFCWSAFSAWAGGLQEPERPPPAASCSGLPGHVPDGVIAGPPPAFPRCGVATRPPVSALCVISY